MRTAAEVTVPVVLDRTDPRPLPRQLTDELRRLITANLLGPGEAVPSSRSLALHLGVSRGTVTTAYDQLLAEGYLAARPGRNTVVNPDLAATHPPRRSRPGGHRRLGAGTTGGTVIDLRPGRPWHGGLANAAWRSAWREAAARPFDTVPGAAGLDALRAELAEHLRRMRGVLRGADQILVTAGARDGLLLLLLALGGVTTVGVEDPGYPSLRRVPARLGARVVPLPVDDHGLITEALPRRQAPEVVLVTPSHQYPLGGSLPIARRQALLDWAADHRVWVVEDDYDSELRYTSQPLPALASLDDPAEGRVVTLGTFAKTLSPGLGAGYLAAPSALIPALVATRDDLGQPVSLVTQQAMAAYLGSGELRRHTQRMRREYRRRRDLVVATLGGLPGVRVYPMDGGLHAVIETTRGEDEALTAAAAGGVLVSGLSGYWSGGSPPRRSGLVFGFGGVDEATLRRGLAVLAAACGQAS